MHRKVKAVLASPCVTYISGWWHQVYKEVRKYERYLEADLGNEYKEEINNDIQFAGLKIS